MLLTRKMWKNKKDVEHDTILSNGGKIAPHCMFEQETNNLVIYYEYHNLSSINIKESDYFLCLKRGGVEL